MSDRVDSFAVVGDGVGVGTPAPAGWRPVSECDCLVLVGLTGVGKSTVLGELTGALPGVTVLPDRRTLTDLLMIPYVQRIDGLAMEPITDRTVRFELTRRYRQLHSGGMAHALSTLSVSPETAERFVIFDGLRGANEVRHALALLPRARFLMLDAPDLVRIRRLASRGDAFDQVSAPASSLPAAADGASMAASVPELQELLDEDGQREVERWVRSGEVSVDDFAAKARIVLAERRNYDPDATREALEVTAGARALVVDTAALSPKEIAQRVVRWLDGT